jgi:hypothetical protein
MARQVEREESVNTVTVTDTVVLKAPAVQHEHVAASGAADAPRKPASEVMKKQVNRNNNQITQQPCITALFAPSLQS